MAVTLELAPFPASVGEARRFTVQTVRGWGRDDLTSTGALLVTELVTNAILHARTVVQVYLERQGNSVRLEVRDGSPVKPALRSHGLDATTGRGLALVSHLAESWGGSRWALPARSSGHTSPRTPVRPHPTWSSSFRTWRTRLPVVQTQPRRDRLMRTKERRSRGRCRHWGCARDHRQPTRRLKTARLLQIPLAVQVQSTQHFNEQMREFALIYMDTDRARPVADTARPVPERLLALVDELTTSFSAFTAAVTAERDEAITRGDTEIDLTYHLPATIVAACRQLEDILNEVDDCCRSGQHLITLATPPESLAFRQWYLGEFVAQIEQGREPLAWPDYVAEHHQDADWVQV